MFINCDVAIGDEREDTIGVIIGNLAAAWLTIFAIAFMTGQGPKFAKWSWGFITRPFRVFWGHYGSYILVLLLGALIGLCYAPAIRSLLGY